MGGFGRFPGNRGFHFVTAFHPETIAVSGCGAGSLECRENRRDLA
jgi:hypothetical protein